MDNVCSLAGTRNGAAAPAACAFPADAMSRHNPAAATMRVMEAVTNMCIG